MVKHRPGKPIGQRSSPAAIAAVFERAVGHHQRGELAQAEPLYREILAQAPVHFDALHLLGIARMQQGAHKDAIDLIRRAVDVDPRNPNKAAALSNLGIALSESGRAVGGTRMLRALAGARSAQSGDALQPRQRAPGDATARRGASELRARACAQAGPRRRAQQPRQRALGAAARAGGAGELRPGDRRAARLCRRARQSRRCAARAAASRRGARERRPRAQPEARLCRSDQQSRQCAARIEALRRSGPSVRAAPGIGSRASTTRSATSSTASSAAAIGRISPRMLRR